MDDLRCVELTRRFGGVEAVSGVNLTFLGTGVTAIIGPNGAGKTTLLNLLTGVLRPDSGYCALGSHAVSQMARHQVADLGIGRTFQEVRLVRRVSVLENVMTARPHQRGEGLLGALTGIGVRRDEERNAAHARTLLQYVGLDAKASEPAGTLSFGQQKLLTLAVCLGTEARLLILDEPVAGVEPGMVRDIQVLLRELSSAGKAIIFTEHDIDCVRSVADRVAVMDHGRIVAYGQSRDVLESSEVMDVYFG